MGKKTKSTQSNLPRVEETDAGTTNSHNFVDVRITRTETISTRGISFALMMDVAMCERIVKELRAANGRIRDILREINDYRLNRDMCTLLTDTRTKLSKYTIMHSDCYWERLDSDLSYALNLLEECHNTLMYKFREDFLLSDLLYMIKTMETVMEEFERKIEQIEDVLK